MLKQKFIPMMSTALLLFSCGGPRAIDVDKPLKLYNGKHATNEDKMLPALKSEKLALKGQEKVKFIISLSKLPINNNAEFQKFHFFAFSGKDLNDGDSFDIDSTILFCDSAAVTYNGKNIECKGNNVSGDSSEIEEWLENPLNDTFALMKDEYKDEHKEVQILGICHENSKIDDKIEITSTICNDIASESYAVYMNRDNLE